MKIGDKLLCKRDCYLEGGNTKIYIKGKYYTVMKIEGEAHLPSFLLNEYSMYFYVDEEDTKKYNAVKWTDYFYTPNEMRQLKLKQIENIENR